MRRIKILLLLVLTGASVSVFAQESKQDQPYLVVLEKLPEYVIAVSESTGRIIGSIIIAIDKKRSIYSPALTELEDVLISKEKMDIRNQTDLLNAMSDLGFDYIDAFSIGEGDMTKIVFRKKLKHRNRKYNIDE